MVSAEHEAGSIEVELVYAPAPHQLMQLSLRLPQGATVADALQASGWPAQLGDAVMSGLKLGLWGRQCTLQQVLRERDRLELYRPLQVDPKEARRQRYRRDGLKRKARG